MIISEGADFFDQIRYVSIELHNFRSLFGDQCLTNLWRFYRFSSISEFHRLTAENITFNINTRFGFVLAYIRWKVGICIYTLIIKIISYGTFAYINLIIYDLFITLSRVNVSVLSIETK